MKQRPILFSTPMVQAILEGRKTMTRRVVKVKEHQPTMALEFLQDTYPRFQFKSGNIHWQIECPYGKVGDVLWVRETWQPSANDVFVHFKADCTDDPGKGWKPSIHMPKDVARIWLKITNVRVEGVEDITSRDCLAEGIEEGAGEGKGRFMRYGVPETAPFYSRFPFSQPRDSFKSLWESINGEESWKANQWVWVVEFERIEKPQEA